MASKCRGKWCPLCYENRKGRCSHKGHAGYRPRRVPYVPQGLGEVFMVKRRQSHSEEGVSSVDDKEFVKGYPLLAGMLFDQQYEDGSERQTSTLLIFADSGMVKACLNDRDAGLSSFAASDTVWGLLDALELGLKSDALDWRAKKPFDQKKRK